MERHLFVYGSLLSGIRSRMAGYLHRNCRLIGEGQVPGRLYDLGRYPGLVYDPEAPTLVTGNILELKAPEKVIPVLDDYEMGASGDPSLNEYRRELQPVKSDEQTVLCWIYLYNLSTSGLKPIVSGNYLDYLHANPDHQQFLDSV